LSGLTTAALVGTGFGLIASLPPSYTTALMAGQGVAGLVAGLVQLILDAIIGNSVVGIETKGMIYFGFCALVTLVCTLCVALLLNADFYLYYQSKMERDITSTQEVDIGDGYDDPSSALILQPVSVYGVFKKIWVEALNIFMIFFVTLSLFPGADAILVKPENPSNTFFTTVLILIFQACDLIGRMTPQFYVAPISKAMPFLVLLRVGFFPISILIALNRYPQLHHDWIPIVVMIVFALTNGYFSTLTMMWAPSRVDTSEEQVAGTMMTFFLQGGIFSGVSTAILVKYLIENVF